MQIVEGQGERAPALIGTTLSGMQGQCKVYMGTIVNLVIQCVALSGCCCILLQLAAISAVEVPLIFSNLHWWSLSFHQLAQNSTCTCGGHPLQLKLAGGLLPLVGLAHILHAHNIVDTCTVWWW